MLTEQQREYQRVWKSEKRLDPAFVHKESEAKKRWRHSHPKKALEAGRLLYERQKEKHKARNRVKDLLRSGRLMKPDHCQSCFLINSELHAHHENYNKPEVVNWLCRSCHARVHKGGTLQ